MNRRAVLRQAAKLGYATPLIAASMKITDLRSAGATHSCPCAPCMDCDENGGCIPIAGCLPE
jgi:hypothetical protein